MRVDINSLHWQEETIWWQIFFFETLPCRLYTSKSPKDRKYGTIKWNQIDYIMVNQRYRNSYKMIKSYLETDVNSDHKLLVVENRIKVTKNKTMHNNIWSRIVKSEVMNILSTALLDVKTSLGVEEKIRKIVKNCKETVTYSGYRHQETLGDRWESKIEGIKKEENGERHEWI